MASIYVYNHTRRLLVGGLVPLSAGHTVNLYTAFTFDSTHTTKLLAETGASQLASANGYTQNSRTISNLRSEILNTSDAAILGDNVTWTANGGTLAADYGLIYSNSGADLPPLYYIDFEGTLSAADGIPLVLQFPGAIIHEFTQVV